MEYLPKIINAFTKGIAIIIPLSPTANFFREIFLDTLLVVEVRIYIARIVRYVELLYISQGQVVVVR